jgi:hypothetical protein
LPQPETCIDPNRAIARCLSVHRPTADRCPIKSVLVVLPRSFGI